MADFTGARDLGGPGRRKDQSQNRTATHEQIKKIVKDMGTAAELLARSAGSTHELSTHMAKSLKSNQELIASLTQVISSAYAGPGLYGPTIGGTRTPGPNFGRPTMGDTRARPNAWPSGGYPGAPVFGYGTRGAPGMPMQSATPSYGSMRHIVAQAMHQRLGMGSVASVQPMPGTELFQAVDRGGNVLAVGSQEQIAQHIEGLAAGSRGIMSRMAGGLNLGGVTGAVRAIPVIGATVMGAEALYQGANFIGEQRRANAAYQSIYGGTNMAGMGQRALQEGFKLRNTFGNITSAVGLGHSGLSGGDADKAFKAVSAMGFQGGERNRRLDFITNNFRSMGMSVDESMQLVIASSTTLTTSLQELHGQLKQVSDMAKETGQSSALFRQSFIRNFSAASAAGFGQSSGTVAMTQTAMSVGLGRPFANTSIAGMTGSLPQLGVTAAYAGYHNPAQFVADSARNPLVAARGMQNRINAALAGTLTPQARQLIESKIKAAGGYPALQRNPNLAGDIGMDNDVVGLINPYAVDAILTAQQVQHDPNNFRQMYGLLVMYVAQAMEGGPVAITQRQLQRNDQRRPGTKEGQQFLQFQKQFGGGAQKAAVGMINGQRVYDPVIEKVVSGLGKNGMVEVQTADGPRVVSVDDATKHYRDQLVSGTAKIMSGERAGETVGDAYGFEMHSGYKSTISSKATGKSALGKHSKEIMEMGLTDSQIAQLAYLRQRLHGLMDDKGILQAAQGMAHGSSGSIMVTMQPELARFLGIQTTGSALVDAGAAANAPPAMSSSGSSTGR